MIRITVTGSECTGKTTLAQALAKHYGTVAVPEYVRRFVDEKQRAPVAADVDAIARGQIALEERLSDRAHRLLVLDTDLLSTLVYSRHYFGSSPDWIEERVRSKPADLYLLCNIDVPWSPDGAQRDRGDRREEMQNLFRRALLDREFPFLELQGDPASRLGDAISMIDDLLIRNA